ncbi:MAG: FAD binding domain-containing protein [Candidatus Cloacimonetes bacterium]|nr:FAD binding domain-containing protein [Candidatus Cloacimonadota bacterium]
MPVTHDFEYRRPQTLDEMLGLLSDYQDGAVILAGGTDLALELKEDLRRPDLVIDIKGLAEFKRIEVIDGTLQIGALVTFSDLLASELIKSQFYPLWESAASVASVGIRNRATMVGNICSAVPCMDSAPVLMCYDAQIALTSKAGEKIVPIAEWFIAPRKTLRKADELVAGIRIPIIAIEHAGVFVKLGRYKGEDLAQANLAILMSADLEYRICFGSVAPVPVRAVPIEEFLRGKKPEVNVLDQAAAMVETLISPITDVRASREYRMHICKVMLKRGLAVTHERLAGKNAEHLFILGG